MKKRASGILLHISSLPGDYGIGDLGKEAYNFVDFLAKAKQTYWQVLPLGVTGFGDSPYQCFSAFAGNPYFIDLDDLIQSGYITESRVLEFELSREPNRVDYELLYKNKIQILRMAYEAAKTDIWGQLELFYNKNHHWLRDFSLFMSIKTKNNGISWLKWDEHYKDSNSDAVSDFECLNKDEIYFWVFTQYFFFNQWEKLKYYANKKGIYIIGDLSMYVSEDSSDVWANPHLFNLDDFYCPIAVAGVPPDICSCEGQLWGNPVYDWDVMEQQEYGWWIQRIKMSFELYDVLRIDHFRGFEAYCEIKHGARDATCGVWVKGPGIKLFNKIKEELGDLDIIAEDLGFITEEVEQLMAETGFPGMKVLQYAFDPEADGRYLPHNYDKNCVVYTGTHDNSTVLGFIKEMPAKDFDFAKEYLRLNEEEGFNWGFIRGAWSSTAYLAIAPMQDFLGLDDSARMNKPSSVNGNWTWRMNKSDLTDELAKRIGKLAYIYRRC